jgi:hypothetical protein
MTHDEVLLAFTVQATRESGNVGFGERAGRDGHGYTKVFGPHASGSAGSSYISIERRYPAVSFAEPLASALQALYPRRGWSAGIPHRGGRFEHDILFEEAQRRFGSAERFVSAIIDAAKTHKVW